MSIDLSRLASFASQLDQAAQHAQAARSVDVPLLLGRRSAGDLVRARLGDADEWARSAAAAPGAFGDAKRAVQQLSTDSIRLRGGRPRHVGADDALRGSLERTSSWAASIRHVVSLADGGDQRVMLTRLVDEADAFTRDPARALTPQERVRLSHLLEVAGQADDLVPEPLLAGWNVRDRAWSTPPAGGPLEGYQHHDARAWVDAARFALDDTHTPGALQARAHELLALGDSQLGRAEMAELARLSMLPPALRPALLPRTTSHARPFGTPRSPASIEHQESRRIVDELRRTQLRDDLLAHPTTTREAMLDEAERLLAMPPRELGEPELRRLAALGMLPDELRPFPQLADRTDAAALHSQRAHVATGAERQLLALDQLHMWVQRERLAGDPAAAAEVVRRASDAIELPAAELTQSQVRTLALASILPDGLRPAWLTSDHARDLLRLHLGGRGATGIAGDVVLDARFQRERLQLLADPALTPQRVTGELEQLLAHPTLAQRDEGLRRLSLLTSLPPRLRPTLPDHAFTSDIPRAWSHSYMHRREAELFERARVVELAARFEADPALTRATATERLDALLAHRDSELTTEQLREVAALSLLDEARRPVLPSATRIPYRHVTGAHPATDAELALDLARVRLELDVPRVHAEVARAPRAASIELRELVARPSAEIGQPQLRRLALLERLPDELRPDVFEDSRGAFARHALGEYAGSIEPLLVSMRRRAADTPEGAAAIRAIAADRSRPLDLRWFDQLRETHPQLLDDIVDARRELQARLDFVLRGRGNREQVRSTLERLPALVDQLHVKLPDPAVFTRMRGELDELVQRNLDRMDGVRMDTYARHPDYAEVGRIESQARTLHQLDALTAANAADGPGRPVPDPDVLTW